MAVSFVAATQAANSGSATVAVNKPPGTTNGDVMVAIVTVSEGRTVTPPTGWTKRAESPFYVFIFTKTAGASEPTSYTFDTGSGTVPWIRGAIASYRGGVYDSVASVEDTTADAELVVPAVPVSKAGRLVYLAGFGTGSAGTYGAPAGATMRTTGSTSLAIADKAVLPGTEAASYFSGLHDLPAVGAGIVIANLNAAPNAPILTAPADGSMIDRNSAQRFDWDFSDPDTGDSQSKYDLQYWALDGSGARVGSATVVSQSLPNTYHDFAAGTFAAGDYEWQVRTYDAQGVVGPYSSSRFFTAATAPSAPTIIAPINGATVSQNETVEWSNPEQDAYQIRRVADNAGAGDTSTVYYDTGEVVSTAARARVVEFPTNNRYEHVQLRRKVGGLWSQWASVRVQVSWTPPPAPTVTLTQNADGGLDVAITNPAPGTGEPAVNYNDVYIDDADGRGERREATLVTPNSTYVYDLPRSTIDYSDKVRVVAVADNGITASS